MKPIVVGISESKVSADPESTLVTYALGSCIAVLLYDAQSKIGGLLHYMLPESSLDRNKAEANPCMFGDTGIPLLIEQVRTQGANPKKMTVRLAGGAQVLDKNNLFEIGKRNYLAARKALWKLGLFVSSEAVGGELSRTVRLDLATGRSWIREGGKPESEFASSGNGSVTGSPTAQRATATRPNPGTAAFRQEAALNQAPGMQTAGALNKSKGGSIWHSAS